MEEFKLKTIRKAELYKVHINLVRNGEYEKAKKILKFLIDKRIVLGIGNIDYEVSLILEYLGFYSTISNRTYNQTFYLK